MYVGSLLENREEPARRMAKSVNGIKNTYSAYMYLQVLHVSTGVKLFFNPWHVTETSANR